MPAADRRRAILAAALDVFSERGFHEASLEDVAARDGISKALIYEHFRSKEDLQRALMETYVHELLERILASTAGAEPGEDRLRRGVQAFLGFVEERREAWRMLFRNLADPEMVEPGMSLFSATRHLERIADHATNIAEDVVYLVEGEIVRHRPAAVESDE